MNKRMFLQAGLVILFSASIHLDAQTSGRPDGMRFVPNVEDQFGSISARPDPLGFHIGTSPNPSSCKHYQAIARIDAADGTPFFLITRSGVLPDLPGPGDDLKCDDSPSETGNGNLIAFRMGSRDKNGERMRSNRLAVGHSYDSTPPPADDKAAVFFTVKYGGLAFRDGDHDTPQIYQHPGGMQAIGDVLAIAVESPRPTRPFCDPFDEDCRDYDVAPEKTQIMFFEVGGDPGAPEFLSQFTPKNAAQETLDKAGLVGITPLADGHYLMLVAGGTATTLFFYRSDASVSDPAAREACATSLKCPDLTWTRMDSWSSDPGHPFCGPDSVLSDDLECLSPDEQYLEADWPNDPAHQTLQFLRQGDINGPLYLAGARGKFTSDANSMDLYRVDCETPLCEAGTQIKLKHIRTRHHIYNANADGEQLVNFAAATGFYVSPTGELIFYATEHDNDGPDGTVKAGEYRHIFMAREGSPTFAPSASAGGPFEVDEGGHVALTGSAAPPITKAFIQLFDELHLQNRFAGFYPVVDYPDYFLDNFGNLEAFQIVIPFHLRGFYRTTRSWNWFAPAGCSIVAVARDLDDPSAPVETKTLAGTGTVEHDPDLREILNDRGTANMDRRVSSVEFLPNCDQYYAGPFILSWDLDGNGSYESHGNAVTFNAAGLDGPAAVIVPVQASHALGGATGEASAKVVIRNVAPRLQQFRITDGAGHVVNIEVPFVLAGLPVTASAGLTDPGLPDHQTATLAWGDGLVESQTDFTNFNDAFGDGIGALAHTHAYQLPGSNQVVLRVRDDDGGEDTAVAIVNVVTPEQAVEQIIAQLDAVIAATTDKDVRADLEKARKALAGSNDNSSNGALNMIRAGNEQAAIAAIGQAIDRLQSAQAHGANVATLIAALQQVIAALQAA